MPKSVFPIILLWLLIVCSSLVWNHQHDRRAREDLALHTARSLFSQIVITRAWNASLQGVYTPVTASIQPNPYLKSPQRDLTTISGLELTMINPAYMTRQISEIAATQEGVQFHITSLKPIRPENKANEWETEWLKSFEHGETERSEFIDAGTAPKFRYMAPLLVEKNCLPCHAAQDYKVGDIRGGISVVMPFPPEKNLWPLLAGHGTIALLGILGIIFFSVGIKRERHGLLTANAQLAIEVAERWKMEKELRLAEREWGETFNAMTDFVSVQDLEHRFLKVNRAMANFLGKPEKELLGKDYHEQVYGTREAWPNCPHNKALALNRSVTEEIDDPHLGCPLLITASPLYDNSGKLKGTVHIARDISANKKAEQSLKQTALEWAAAMDASDDAIYLLDLTRRIIRANKAFYLMTGSTPQTAVGEHIEKIVHPTGEKVPCPVCRAQTEQRDAVLIMEPDHPDNPTGRPLEIIVKIVRNDQDQPLSIFMSLRDLTNARKSSEEKYRLENQLRQAQKMETVGTLAGGIAHDFNNILSIILGYTDLAKEATPADSKIIKDLDQVLKAGHRARDLVKQILSFSRQSRVERVLLEPQPLVKEALKMLRSSLPTTITIEEKISPDCGAIDADPTQLHQILMNLCTNAFHAMEDKGGVLRVTLQIADSLPLELQAEPGGQDKTFIELAVSDSGHGIGPDIINKIFDPFFTTKKQGKGTGMGLAITYGIIKEYGGTITVDSQLGAGSTFHVYLPQSKGAIVQTPAEEELYEKGEERILFVDDEEVLVNMGAQMLEGLGYHVTAKQSSHDALETFRKQPGKFDLVITDQTMPGMTGLEMARRMLRIRPDISIILCTGYSSLVNEEVAMARGIKGFVLKPVSKQSFAKLIRQALANNAPVG